VTIPNSGLLEFLFLFLKNKRTKTLKKVTQVKTSEVNEKAIKFWITIPNPKQKAIGIIGYFSTSI
jgi:hypothetical protein